MMRALIVSPLLVLAAGFGVPAEAQTGGKRTPLLIEGKSTLYQRVLTRPGVKIVPQPGGTPGKELPALSALFVYAQKTVGADNFIRKARCRSHEDYGQESGIHVGTSASRTRSFC